MGQAERRRVVVIGAGFGGLGLAIRLKREGIHAFTVLEKAESLGGTWRENTYPGAACDVPSILYSYSFEPNCDWTRRWSPQSEIRAYMERCAEENGVLPHIRFGVEVTGARFDETSGTWTVSTRTGEELAADVLVCAVGQLHHPAVPNIPGLDRFQGPCFHSARWDWDLDLTGERVAVVGNAASAIQFIPEIAPRVERLLVFQRTPNWMIPRGDRPYTARERRLLARVPGLRRALRALAWLTLETTLYPLIAGHRRLARFQERKSTRYMEGIVADPALRAKLVPDYPMGGKRILITDGYYEALVRENVELVTDGIDHVTEKAIVTRDGTTHPVDAVILATGFRTNPFLATIRVEGRGGRTLEQDWADGAAAYYGLTVSGYPNFFMLYGPNTNLGHNSIIFMMEAQMRYVLSAIDALREHDLRYLDLRPGVMRAFNDRVQEKLRTTAWAAAGPSWYKDQAGRITNNWPWTTVRYWRKTRRVDLADYDTVARRPMSESVGYDREPTAVVAAGGAAGG